MAASDYKYDDKSGELVVTHNSGFFAICTITLNALMATYPGQRDVTVFWNSQAWWRDENQTGMNLFELYFKPRKTFHVSSFTDGPPLSQYHIYEDLNFRQITPFIQNYFAPSDKVRETQERFRSEYGIEYGNTIGLCYRATDKWWEVAQIQPLYFVREVRRLLKREPNLRVLVQTDQRQVRDYCLKELGERAFFLNEMPVTTSTNAIHRIPASERGISNFELGVRLLAAVNILANCKYVITHMGSIGLWTYLYRGTAKNACQLMPGLPEAFSRFDGELRIKRGLFKLIRRVMINHW